jgi:hypothetical protein
LLLALSALMFLTRHVDWYALSLPKAKVSCRTLVRMTISSDLEIKKRRELRRFYVMTARKTDYSCRSPQKRYLRRGWWR